MSPNFGTNAIVTAEPGTKPATDFGPGRTCDRCEANCNRYAKRRRGYLLCSLCLSSAPSGDLDLAAFVGREPSGDDGPLGKTRRTGRSGRRGVYLPGLAAAMDGKNWTSAKLGRKAGTTGPQVARLKRLGARASLKTAGELARCLGVSVSRLTGEGPR